MKKITFTPSEKERENSPEEGVIGVMGVAMMPLALSAAICCICTAATVATGDKYADWATRACCWTSCTAAAEDRQAREAGSGQKRQRGVSVDVDMKKKNGGRDGEVE